MIDNQNKSSNYPISTILDKLSNITETSNLIPVIIYPIEQCYINWRNIFVDEYPIRSTIRAIISTGAFATGPLLTQIANFTWLKDRCTGLYQTIPVFNLLPTDVGTAICSAYVCGYFVTWVGIELTDIYNNYKFGGTNHYLTQAKIENIHQFVTNNNFNISQEEIKTIFNKINVQLNKDPKNRNLNNMIVSLRKGDLQTVLDNAHLLETEIAIINNKINTLLAAEQLNYTPVVNDNRNVLNNNSIESLPEDDALLTENSSEQEHLAVSENNSSPPIHNNARFVNNPPPSEQEHPDRNRPPIAAILHQYQSQSKNKRRTPINNSIAIDTLRAHKSQLKSKRFVDPTKSFL